MSKKNRDPNKTKKERRQSMALTPGPIEQGVPIPSGRTVSRYPFDTMNVGDSFFVAAEDRKRASSAVTASAKRKGLAGKKFSVHMVDGGVRCWRKE